MCTGRSERKVRINCVHACVHAGSERAAACRGKRREEQGVLAACLLAQWRKKIRGGAAPPTEREREYERDVCESEVCAGSEMRINVLLRYFCPPIKKKVREGE